MTKAELAELRGEIFGCKILLFNCLSMIAGIAKDPSAHVQALQTAALEGILKAAPSNIPPQHLKAFQDAAAGIVVQAVEGVQASHRLSNTQGQA